VIKANNDPNQVFEYPSTINSFERSLIHKIAEEMGLNHKSQGEGFDR